MTNSYESSFENNLANTLHCSLQVIGLSNVPIAGDEFEVVASLDIAREKAEKRAESLWNERISAKAGDGKVTLSSLASAVSAGKLSGLDLHQLNIIMKVDLQVCAFAIHFTVPR
jgi:translation initiation factor IF-2